MNTIDWEDLKASTICVGALRPVQQFDYVARNKSMVKISNAIQSVLKKKKKNQHMIHLIYKLELNVAKKTEARITKKSIDPVILIADLLNLNQDLLDRYFKINWNHVMKFMNISTCSNQTTIEDSRNASEYCEVFCEILNKEVDGIRELFEWQQWIRENNAYYLEKSKKNLQISRHL